MLHLVENSVYPRAGSAEPQSAPPRSNSRPLPKSPDLGDRPAHRNQGNGHNNDGDTEHHPSDGDGPVRDTPAGTPQADHSENDAQYFTDEGAAQSPHRR